MIEEDEGSYYVEFFNQNLIPVLVGALILAPVVPGWIAQWALIVVAVLAAIVSLSFQAVRVVLLRKLSYETLNSTVLTLVSEDARAVFRAMASTTVILSFIVAWLGFTKILWVFDSFFTLVAAIHILNMVLCALMELANIRGDIDELSSSIHGASTDELPDSPESTRDEG
jgi:DNA integrity scanning protein DisA with diadenylate cyclase activity